MSTGGGGSRCGARKRHQGLTSGDNHDDDDEAAAAAVEAENVTEDEDEEGEEGDEGEEGSEEDDDNDDDDEDDCEALGEQLENLAHSPGAALLVTQAYGWLEPWDGARYAIVEAGFDAMCERLCSAEDAATRRSAAPRMNRM